MANTTNFNWETPDDTDLVKDGAAAIRTLGSAIDTSLVDLKGGTTGQILSKATNTDMDFTWITNDVGDITEVTASAPLTGGGSSGSITVGIQDGTTAQKGAVQLEDSTSSTSTTKASTPNSVKSAYDLANAAIPKSLIDAEGDLIVGDAADAVQRLAIGSNAQVLTVDTSVDGKIKWATPAGGGKVLQVVSATYATQTTTTSANYEDTGLSGTITPSSTSSKILVMITNQMGVTHSSDDCYFKYRIVRGATTVWNSGFNDGWAQASSSGLKQFYYTISPQYLDSPATTSATTYKLQFNKGGANATVYAQYSNETAQIILIEIGA